MFRTRPAKPATHFISKRSSILPASARTTHLKIN
jgi:hypothetical protein